MSISVTSNGVNGMNGLNGINGVNGPSQPQTPAINSLSLTEYAANPSPTSEALTDKAVKAAGVPEAFLLPSGYPDVGRLPCFVVLFPSPSSLLPLSSSLLPLPPSPFPSGHSPVNASNQIKPNARSVLQPTAFSSMHLNLTNTRQSTFVSSSHPVSMMSFPRHPSRMPPTSATDLKAKSS